MRQAALPATARFTYQSASSRQCFGHPCLPARARGLPTRQCFRGNRIEIDVRALPDFGRPRGFNILAADAAPKISGNTSRALRARAKVSFVHAGFSRSAFSGLGLRFLSFHLAFVGLAQTDPRTCLWAALNPRPEADIAWALAPVRCQYGSYPGSSPGFLRRNAMPSAERQLATAEQGFSAKARTT